MFKNKSGLPHSYSHILNHTEYLGSTDNKIIHSTKVPCQDALLIEPNSRWYIRSIPKSGEYVKCSKCFPNS